MCTVSQGYDTHNCTDKYTAISHSFSLSPLGSCLPLRQVEQRDDGGLSVIRRVLGHNLLNSGVVLVREVEERSFIVVWGVFVL